MSKLLFPRLLFVIIIFSILAGCNNAEPVSGSLDISQSVEEEINDQPVIDGVLDPGEWDRAQQYFFADGSEIYLLYIDNHLYLGISATSDEMITANIFLSRGEEIEILHTSAALGTAVYQPEGDTWRKTQDFEWCCRSRFDSEEATAARMTFFDQGGWLGVNSFLGNENELEYKIQLDGSENYLAVNFLRTDGSERKLVWPTDVIDGPAQPIDGGFPDTLDFFPETWFDLGVQK